MGCYIMVTRNVSDNYLVARARLFKEAVKILFRWDSFGIVLALVGMLIFIGFTVRFTGEGGFWWYLAGVGYVCFVADLGIHMQIAREKRRRT